MRSNRIDEALYGRKYSRLKVSDTSIFSIVDCNESQKDDEITEETAYFIGRNHNALLSILYAPRGIKAPFFSKLSLPLLMDRIHSSLPVLEIKVSEREYEDISSCCVELLSNYSNEKSLIELASSKFKSFGASDEFIANMQRLLDVGLKTGNDSDLNLMVDRYLNGANRNVVDRNMVRVFSTVFRFSESFGNQPVLPPSNPTVSGKLRWETWHKIHDGLGAALGWGLGGPLVSIVVGTAVSAYSTETYHD